jgi:hypothetical protein
MRPHLEGDATLPGESAATLSVRLRSQARFVAQPVENMFSKMARSMLREIRMHSKQELIQHIHLYFQEVNAAPGVFRWRYKMDEVSVD